MPTLKSNRCYSCNKIFCCVDCCTEHIRKKHPGRESKCPLCRTEGLMVKNFANQEFLCHVVFNHLPLRCRYCDERFSSSDDLKAIGVCNRRLVVRVAPAIQEDPCASLLSPETSASLNKTPSGQLGAKRKEYSIDGDYNGNFGNFTSPPELSRNTSTPMHGNLVSNENFQFKTPRPNFSLKTPKIASHSAINARRNERSGTKENSVSDATSFKDAISFKDDESPSSESNYASLSSFLKSSIIDRTPLRSMLSGRSSTSDSSCQEFSRTTGRKLGAMEEVNEDPVVEEVASGEMELTDPQGGLVLEEESRSRVLTINARRNERSETKENSVLDASSFKDAESPSSESNYASLTSFSTSSIIDRTPLRSILSGRSSMSDSSGQEFSRTTGRKLGAMEEVNEDHVVDDVASGEMELTDAQGGIVLEEESRSRVLAFENVSQRRTREHGDSVKRVRFSDQFEAKSEVDLEETSAEAFNSTEAEEFFEARQSISETSMAVVEKLSTSSALIARENEDNSEKEKKIIVTEMKSPVTGGSREESVSTASSSRVVMMVVVENSGSVNAADLAPLIDSSLKKLEVVASGAAPRKNAMEISPRNGQGGRPGTTVVSVDSYMSVSTVECYETPDTTIDVPQRLRESPKTSNTASGSGGIFSAMAHAMKVAFRNLSGTSSSSSVPHEQASHKKTPALLSSIPESSGATSEVSSSLATALVPRTAKRSRDADELQPTQYSESMDSLSDVRSPLPKRPRGWYRIRAREPIARMRGGNNLATSPRGVSSETQCFQQGSLSVGDTILPLPSRAHQSTQTD